MKVQPVTLRTTDIENARGAFAVLIPILVIKLSFLTPSSSILLLLLSLFNYYYYYCYYYY